MRMVMRRWACVPVLAILVTGLLAGCGGGGSGSSPVMGGPAQPSMVTITGVLQDQTSGNFLPGRTVTVQGTGLAGVTDGSGAFSIANVPVASVTLVIVDAAGSSNGTYSVDLSTIGGSPRNLGTIKLAVSGGAGAPPGGPPIPPH